jgi:flagellar basal body-associated protein FliL
MSDNTTITPISGKHALDITKAQSDSRERVTLIICVTVVIALLCVGLIIALCFAEHKDKDYVSILLPVVSGSVFGLLGFRAGSKTASK